ncbi:RagB/SusD family nutrient uptake outer membrane protein [Proteiniphilum sp. X52]|uniref:RagB/SusD family nutrient uptake outer membrane protein n=1 Tax=Proteiniphilum sp. X52 TaxID=2382159 RepID=UPI000F0A23BF|nr:RagB/SusD family nutrient uptake outer membrane protein [Proteiniphilum sp. X52]RNC66408.1 RagB/SusD family nutrient uptake outer membrane protein [Proteiniphilum sp. X52]
MKANHCILLLIALFAHSSCSDLLTEEPASYYKKENFFISPANAEMSIIGIYDVFAKLEHYGQFEMAFHSSDDTYYIQGTATDNTRRDISHYTLSSANQWVEQVWSHKYQGLDRANFAISGIESMEGYKGDTPDPKLVKLVAEAKFLRAFLAFDLVKYWGDVPFKTSYSGDYESAYGARVARELIYDQIIDDLNFAKANLAWADAGSSPERATQGAARGLLMRILLQRAGYSLQMDGVSTRPDDTKREEYFNAVISEWGAFQEKGYHGFFNGGYLELFKGFSHGTLNSKESLFEIAFHSADGSSEDSGNWATYNGPAVAPPNVPASDALNHMGRANAFFRVVPEWKDFFEETDERRDVMVCTYQYNWNNATSSHVKVENSNKRNWYPGKWRREWMPLGYKDPNNTDVNYCNLRYADVVLMAAEAYNELNQTATAWSLLNSVRIRAGATQITGANYADLLKSPKVHDLPFIDDATEAGKFRTALYWERGFELAFEGQRKFDLIRWGFLKEALVLFNGKTDSRVRTNYPAGNNFIKGKHELFPIPLDEIQVNSKLEGKNNPQY